ncbi:MAG: hypothetical protein ABS76_06510 [Pelagibacterium sp. SCN 64-44]|nr:MAG: hypothetical protein ABS76_06510 [Pelagibacterium sp. SCN 64-44]
MKLVELFPAERVFVDVDVANRKELLGFLAQRTAHLGLVDRQLCLQALIDREELGSTGLGNGIAIPHARIEGLDRAVGMLVTLARPIDFEAVDQEPVDIAIMLLLPEQSGSDQMKVLSGVAKMARQEPVMNALRQAGTAEDVVEILRDAEDGAY